MEGIHWMTVHWKNSWDGINISEAVPSACVPRGTSHLLQKSSCYITRILVFVVWLSIQKGSVRLTTLTLQKQHQSADSINEHLWPIISLKTAQYTSILSHVIVSSQQNWYITLPMSPTSVTHADTHTLTHSTGIQIWLLNIYVTQETVVKWWSRSTPDL